jgi:predicted small lipoprotein YifL
MLREFEAPVQLGSATRARLVVAIAVLAWALAGCGIKGPLRLPPAATPSPESAPAKPPPTPPNPASPADAGPSGKPSP